MLFGFEKNYSLLRCILIIAGFGAFGVASAQDKMSLQEVTEAEITRARLEQEELKRRASHHVAQGNKLLKARNYRKALEEFVIARGLDPDNKSAISGRSEALRYLEARGNGSTATQAIAREKVRQQYTVAEVNQYYSLAKKYLDQASVVPAGVSPEQKVKVISNQMRLLSQAEDAAIKASLRIEGLGANASGVASKVELRDLVLKIRTKRRELQGELDSISRSVAMAEVEKEKKVVGSVEAERRAIMLKEAKEKTDKQEYFKAQQIYRELLRLNPADEEVKKLDRDCKLAEYRQREKTVSDMVKEHRLINLENIQRATISEVSPKNPLRFPKNWAVMVENKKLKNSKEVVSMAVQKTRRILENSYSFEFVETDFQLILDTIRNRTGLNIVVPGGDGDSSVLTQAFTFSFRNMRLSNILTWIMRRSGMRYDIDSNGIIKVISKDQSSEKASTVVLDIRDIAYAITDAKKMPQDDGDDDDDDDDDDDEGAEDTITLGEILSKFINTNSEGEAETKINIKDDGQLILTATPEIRKQVESLLQQLRAAKTIQVSVSARFLTIQDSFWEEFRSEFMDFNNNYNATPATQRAGQVYYQQGVNSDVRQGVPSTTTVTNSPGVAPTMGNSAENFLYYDPTSSISGTFDPKTYYNGLIGSFYNQSLQGLTTVFGNDGQTYSNSGLSYQIQQLGYLGGLQCQWFIQLIRETSRADELFSPQIVVYNNRYGWIRFVEEWPYIGEYQAGDGDFGIVAVIHRINEGCSLQVRPNVSSDKKYITVDAQPRVIKIENKYAAPYEFHYGVNTTTLPNALPLQLPQRFRHDAKTYATIPDGGAILITGLSTNVNSRGRSGTPLLEDLPVVGNAFSNRYYQKNKRNYACLINAKMIILDEEEARQTGVR